MRQWRFRIRRLRAGVRHRRMQWAWHDGVVQRSFIRGFEAALVEVDVSGYVPRGRAERRDWAIKAGRQIHGY